MTEVTEALAKIMLDMGTFRFRPDDPVVWASGYTMPVYNDNRLLLSYPEARALVVQGFSEILERWGCEVSAIVGTATAGIAPATSLADALGKRLYYVRSGSKDLGLGRQVEGVDREPRGRVLLVEDLVSTGGSSAEAALAVHNAGLTLNHGVAIFSYGFERADDRFASLPFDFVLEPVVELGTLLRIASQQSLLDSEQIEVIESWIASPFEWGADRSGKGD